MSNKANLEALLAETGGSARHRKPVVDEPVTQKVKKVQPPPQEGRGSPITVHFPKQVRDQLKILAVQKNTTLHTLMAEALNDLFAKHGKPEIAPAQAQHAE